ncbi:unnamed protein product [Owenia fusiformis]|uniref:Uncharacterized protein n=1 Tax=Owenia fusiformis TaxID=6347 RepID=A0A8J1TFU2_OWEFU|nr:unnamed protein product [Owenia fusiformis]
MVSSTDVLTQLIQDAVLKLCTQNIVFNTSLEIDGIICVSPGEKEREIVVKMHRTIMKPAESQGIQQSWSPQVDIEASSDYCSNQSSRKLPYKPSHDPAQRNREFTNRENRLVAIVSTAQTPNQYLYNSQTPVNSPLPTATQVTPGGRIEAIGGLTIKEESSLSPGAIKRSLSDYITQDTPTCKPIHKHARLDTNTTGIDNQHIGPHDESAILDTVNIKQEEPITIELDEGEKEGGYDEESTEGASWMQGDSSIDDMPDQNQDLDHFRDTWSHSNATPSWSLANIPDNNPRPYHCTKCSKQFKRPAHLENHMRVHTGEKPFQCGLCLKRFTVECNMKTHLKKVHKNSVTHETST